MTDSKNLTVQMYDRASVVEAAGNNTNVKNMVDAVPKTNLMEMLGRPFVIYNFSWDKGYRHMIPLDLRSAPLWKEYSKFFSFAKCDLEVELKINGTPFHQGMMMMSYIPGIYKDTEKAPTDLVYLSSFPHVRVGASTQEPVKMIIPFNSNRDMIRKEELIQSPPFLGYLRLIELFTLNYSDGSSPSISANVWVTPRNIEINGYTGPEFNEPTNVLAQAACGWCGLSFCDCVEEQGDDDCDQNSSLASKGIMNLLQTLGLGGMAKSVSPLSGSVAYSRDKPDTDCEGQKFVRRTAGDWGTVKGTSLAHTLSSFTPGLNVYLSDNDYINRKTPQQYAQNYGFFKKVNFDSTATRGTMLYSLPVSPVHMCAGVRQQQPSVYNYTMISNTPTSFLAQPFRYWRGSLRYKFNFVATQFHSATVAVMWIPNSYDPVLGPSEQGYVNNFSKAWIDLVEVQGPTEYEVEIPYMGQYRVKEICGAQFGYNGNVFPSPVATNNFQKKQLYNAINGHIYVFVVNQLVNPSNCPSFIEFGVWGAAGKDFELFSPNGGFLESVNFIGSPDTNAVDPSKEVPQPTPDTFINLYDGPNAIQDEVEEQGKDDDTPDQDVGVPGTEPLSDSSNVTQRDDNNAVPITDSFKSMSVCQEIFGENQDNIMDLIKRYCSLIHLE